MGAFEGDVLFEVNRNRLFNRRIPARANEFHSGFLDDLGDVVDEPCPRCLPARGVPVLDPPGVDMSVMSVEVCDVRLDNLTCFPCWSLSD